MAGDVVLVTGGDGFLGQHVVKFLQERADYIGEIRVLDVRAFTKKLDYKDTKQVVSVVGSITDEEVLLRATRGVNCVMNLAGVVSVKTFPDTDLMEEVNIRGVQMLIQACVVNNVDLLIHCSTVDAVIGYENIINGTEKDVTYPKHLLFDSYALTKCQGEIAVLKANGEILSNGNRLQTVVLRPALMYGELDPYFITKVIKTTATTGGTLTKFGSKFSYIQIIYVGNAAWSFICANKTMRANPELGGEAFFITDNTPTDNIFNYSKPYLEVNNFKLSLYRIPYIVMYVIAIILHFVLWIISPVYQFQLPFTLSTVRSMNMKISFLSSKAAKLLSYKPLFEPDECKNRSLIFYSSILDDVTS